MLFIGVRLYFFFNLLPASFQNEYRVTILIKCIVFIFQEKSKVEIEGCLNRTLSGKKRDRIVKAKIAFTEDKKLLTSGNAELKVRKITCCLNVFFIRVVQFSSAGG